MHFRFYFCIYAGYRLIHHRAYEYEEEAIRNHGITKIAVTKANGPLGRAVMVLGNNKKRSLCKVRIQVCCAVGVLYNS